MKSLQRAASIAAFLIVIAMLIHNLNALYLEPYTLGFADKAKDYGNMAKIENALWSFSFTSSGISHMVVGVSMMILGLFLSEAFKQSLPIASRLIFLTATLSGLGFLLTGISDIPGTVYAGILRDLNPAQNTEILLTTTLLRGMVNVLAIFWLGCFAGMVAWSAKQTESFSRGFRVFGWFNVLPGIMSLYFPPAGFAYIQLLPLWMLWLGLRLPHLQVSTDAMNQ